MNTQKSAALVALVIVGAGVLVPGLDLLKMCATSLVVLCLGALLP